MLYAELFPLWAIVVIVAVVVIGCGVTVVIILKKRKITKDAPAAPEKTPSESQS